MGIFKGKIPKFSGIRKAKKRSIRKHSVQTGAGSYQKRLGDYRKRMLIRTGVIAAVLLLGILIVTAIVNRWTYKGYKVVESSAQEDTLSTSYVQLEESLLKFTGDGASLLSEEGKTLWNQTIDMNNPTADVCKGTAVVYDENGTSMVMLGKEGKIGQVSTDMPILKARVAEQGVVAAILEDGENTWINFYSTSGEEIATGMTRVDSPGYPVDLAVSPDGMLIMVSYLFVEDNQTTSYVAFYNFGKTGQGQMDNIVSGYTYEGILTPQVQYLSKGKSVAFKEDGFVIYSGSQIPKVSKEVTVDREIISTFCDEKHVGMVFHNDDEKAKEKYTLAVYGVNGKKIFEKNFDIEYTSVKISGGQILMYNDTQLCVFSIKGHKKFNGSLNEGKIYDIFKLNGNRYQVIVESGIKTISLG